ncbi:RICIN domain-containing protein [Streptomyces sp. NPDC014995]|uniref:RICIN domain-containing protein n=1 Tax=Streptomyces sp. NPDC014995 TaxID=3364936 RepID=UPI0036F72F9A
MRTTCDVNGVSRFSYRLDGNVFSSFGGTYQLAWGGFRGDRVGPYTCNPNGTGYVDVDVDSVRYTIAPTRVYTCVSVRSGKVADVYRASNADGAAVIQWLDTGASNQRWAFLPVHGERLPHDRLCPQRQGARRVALIQYRDVGSSHQRWTFHRVTG